MIIGHIADGGVAGAALTPALGRALEYLRATDFSKCEDGRYDIDGDRIYAKVWRYLTKPARDCRPESHRRYADVQFVAEGCEFLGWCPLTPGLKVATPYDAESDVAFYEKLVPENDFLLPEGGFAILLPKDIHSPGIRIGEPAPVLKVIVKIEVGLLGRDGK